MIYGFEPVIFHKLITSVPVIVSFQSDLGITLGAAGNTVASWQSQSNPSGSFVIANTSSIAQPTFNSTGLNGFPTLTFDGVQQCLRDDTVVGSPILFSWTNSAARPCYVFAVVKQVSWTSGARLYTVGQSGGCRQSGVTPNLQQAFVSAVNNNTGAPIGTWVRLEEFNNNSATSFLKLGATNATGATPGFLAQEVKTLSLGGNFGPGSATNGVLLTPSNVSFAALLACSGLPTTAERLALSNAVRRKYGFIPTT
jgi:hypothetical protein